MSNKLQAFMLALFICMVMLASQASAFAITRSNTEKNPLMIMPGEEGGAWIEYQNLLGNEEVMTKIIIKQGKEIITNTEEIEKEMTIAAGENGKRILIKIKMPTSTEIGEEHRIIFVIAQKKTNNSQGLGVSTEMEQTITVIAGEKTESIPNIPPIKQESDLEKPQAKSYEKFLILLVAIIGILTLVKVLIIMNKKN